MHTHCEHVSPLLLLLLPILLPPLPEGSSALTLTTAAPLASASLP